MGRVAPEHGRDPGRADAEQLVENAAAADLVLDADALDRLGQAAAVFA